MHESKKRIQPDAWQIGLLGVLWLLATGRLRLTGWTVGLYVPQVLAFCGLFIGLGLGYGRFRPLGRSLLVFGYAVVLVPWQLVTLQPPADTAWMRLLNVSARLYSAVGAFWRGQEVVDPLLFLAATGMLAWGLAAFSGYAWGRGPHFLAATLPPAVVALLVQVYDPWSPARMWFLAFLLLAWLVLLARWAYLLRREARKQRGIVDLPENLSDVHWQAIWVSAVLLLAAWSTPPLSRIELRLKDSANDVRSWWQQIEHRLEKAVAPLESNQPAPPGDYYSSRMALGRGTPLREDVLFTVETEQPPTPRYYWRGYVYDQYEKGYWYASTDRTLPFRSADAALPLAARPDGKVERFRFIRWSGGALIYTPPYTAWVGRPAFVDFWPVEGRAYDINAWRAQTAFYAGETYLVRAWVSNPTVSDLRAAGQTYPDWVQMRYLQVPEDFSPRLQALAFRLAEGQPTPYDVAQTITAFLRMNVQYTPSLDVPPGVDPLAWAILDAKRAFCNYYASAEVLMLRSLGIPARMAVGFAQGATQDNRIFKVRWLDAHAWPEVYFPKYGWVIFEPTAGQPPLERPLERASVATPPHPPPTSPIPLLDDALPTITVDQPSVTLGRTPLPTWVRWLLMFVGLAAAGIASLRKHPLPNLGRHVPRWLHRQAVARYGAAPHWLEQWMIWAWAAPIERVGGLLTWFLHHLTGQDASRLTPYERAARLKGIAPRQADRLDVIMTIWIQHLYSPQKVLECPPELRRDCIMVIITLLWQWVRRWPRALLRPWRE